MKSTWKPLPGSKSVQTEKFPKGLNLSDHNYPALSPRSPWTPNGQSLNHIHDLHPERLLNLCDGDLGCVVRYPDGNVSVFSIDDRHVYTQWKCTTTPDFAEMHIDEFGLINIFSCSEEASIIFLALGNLGVRVSQLSFNYMTVHKNRLITAEHDHCRIVIYDEGYYDKNHAKGVKFVDGPRTNCRGLTSYKGTLVYFADDDLYQILGDSPENMDMSRIAAGAGLASLASIANARGRLIWLSKYGVFEWNGGLGPVMISEPVNKYLKYNPDDLFTLPQGICFGDYYYLSVVPKTGTPTMLTYSLQHKTWRVSQGENIPVSFLQRKNQLLGITRNKEVVVLNGNIGEEDFSWTWESEIFPEPAQKVRIHAEIPTPLETPIEVAVIVDGQSPIKIGEFKECPRGFVDFLVPLHKTANAQTFKVVLTGPPGDIKITKVEQKVRVRG